MNRRDRETVQAIFARISVAIEILGNLAACYDDAASFLKNAQSEIDDEKHELDFEECKAALAVMVRDPLGNLQTAAVILDQATDILAGARALRGGTLA